MKYRLLGRTGVAVSELGLGAMLFGTRTEPREAAAILDRALAAGINFLDTADCYGGGRSEEVLGALLHERGVRARVVIGTKFHFPAGDSDPLARGNSRRHLIAQCEASLRRLQTEWIDILYIHRPDAAVPIDETLRAMDDLVRSGKVRYLGCSTFAAWQVVEALWASDRLRANRIAVEQPPYNLLDRRIERELIPMAHSHGIGLVTWAPIAGGLLSGKYRSDRPRPRGSRYEVVTAEHVRRRYAPGVDAVVDALRRVAEGKGCTLVQLSLAWVLRSPAIACAIVGPRTAEQLEDNLGAHAVELNEDDLRAIDGIAPPQGSIAPFYELEGVR